MEILQTDSRLRVLDAAEALFSKRGYAAVRLQDIADAVQIRHASLYYHAPGGKEQLFIEVMERHFVRLRDGLENVLASASDDLGDQIRAVARWLALQTPVDLARIFNADMLAIDQTQAQRLSLLAYDALREPIVGALRSAAARGVVDLPDTDLAAIALIGLLQSVHSIPRSFLRDDQHLVETAQATADLLLNGLLKRLDAI